MLFIYLFYGLSLGMTAPRYFLALALHLDNGAKGGNRTHMILLSPEFESGASANFATLA